MVRNFTKEKFIEVLQDRPATIRHLQKPDDKYIARCLRTNSNVSEYIDKSWLTLPVLQELVLLFGSQDKSLLYNPEVLAAFPLNIRNNLPTKDLMLCKKLPQLTRYFPNAPYDLYLESARTGNVDYKDIPEQHKTDEILAILFARNPDEIPDEAFTDNVIDTALKTNGDCINHIPERFMTHDRLIKAFDTDPSLTLFKSIPVEICDQDLADKATEKGNNIEHIPETYITKTLCLKYVTASSNNLRKIPKKYIDEEIVLTTMTSPAGGWYRSFMSTDCTNFIPKKYLTESFLLKLAERDVQNKSNSCFGISNYWQIKEIKDGQWIKILKICSKALRLIEKNKQTDAMINTFFENASVEVIDHLAQYINLSRIKKEHVPYMIGTTVSLFQDIITRKMTKKPKRNLSKEVQEWQIPVKNQAAVPTSDLVGIDLTDSEYLDLIKKFPPS